MAKKTKKFMTLYVGSKGSMLQLRTTGDHRFSDQDGIWFAKSGNTHPNFTFDEIALEDSQPTRFVCPIGRQILKTAIGKNKNLRFQFDRILIVSAWQMNIFRKNIVIDDDIISIFVKAFEKAFGLKVKVVPETRQLGSVLF